MNRLLSREQSEAYRRDGVLFPIPVLEPAEVARARAGFDRLIAGLGGAQRAIRQPHLEQRWAYDLATHPRVLDAVEDVLGPEIVVGSTLVFFKPAKSGGFVSWHQDALYPGLRTDSLVTAWIALVASTCENGCMRVIPGSHRDGIQQHREAPSAENLLRQGQTLDEIDENAALDLVLEPGEMSLHHGDVVHGSNPNRFGPDRIGFVARYLTPAGPKSAEPAIHARGYADCSEWRLLASPPA